MKLARKIISLNLVLGYYSNLSTPSKANYTLKRYG